MCFSMGVFARFATGKSAPMSARRMLPIGIRLGNDDELTGSRTSEATVVRSRTITRRDAAGVTRRMSQRPVTSLDTSTMTSSSEEQQVLRRSGVNQRPSRHRLAGYDVTGHVSRLCRAETRESESVSVCVSERR